MKQKWKSTQYVELSIDEIFCFMDKLNAVQDDPQKVWDVVDNLLWEMESQLELSPNFLKELAELDLNKDFVEVDINNLEDLFSDDDDFENNYATAQDYVNYVLYMQNKEKTVSDNKLKHIEAATETVSKDKYDIPFMPRLNF